MNDHDCPTAPSRRRAIERVGATLAAAPTLLAATNEAAAQPAGGASRPAGLQDPRDKYPQPPFPTQHQEWPGLTTKMTPRPDHGEQSYVGSGRLAGRKALITGGDSGIGRAAAIAFAREGADVAFGYLPQEEEDAQEVVKLIQAAGRKAVPLPGDIREEAFCTKLVSDAVRALGGLDILVNNAARQIAHDSLLDIPTEHFDWTFKTNVYANFWITKAALPHLKPGSAIVNTSSVNAFDPSENLVDYAATKAVILNFTRSLAKQLADKGIHVNAVAPGPFWTPLQPSGGQPTDALPKFGADTPMGRCGQPAEIAPLYVLLASGEDSYTTGQVFGATGGKVGP
jgi:NAD(P)-dependent dehydrogenase (short-subunit alcohol dehydrogenase family)